MILYNANPLSVKAAIDVLAGYELPRVLILGDMAELGADAGAMHAEMGTYAKQKNIDVMLTCGELAKESFECFSGRGKAYPDQASLLVDIAAWISEDSQQVFLVKGSRSAGMEHIVNAFVNLGEVA